MQRDGLFLRMFVFALWTFCVKMCIFMRKARTLTLCAYPGCQRALQLHTGSRHVLHARCHGLPPYLRDCRRGIPTYGRDTVMKWEQYVAVEREGTGHDAVK